MIVVADPTLIQIHHHRETDQHKTMFVDHYFLESTMGIRKDKKSGKWIVTIGSGKNGNQVRRKFQFKEDAEEWLKQQQASIKFSHKLRPNTSVDELIDRYHESKGHLSVRHRNDSTNVIRRLCKELHIKKVQDVTLFAFEGYKSRSDLRVRTINKHIGLFKAMMTYAVRNQLVSVNPLAGYQLKKGPSKQRRALREEECREILKSLKIESPDVFYPIIFTFLSLGLRKAELCTLEWTDIDFNRNQMHIQDKLDIIIENIQPHRVKWGSRRVLPLKKNLRDVLYSLPRTSKFVFATSDGTMRFHNLIRDLKYAMRNAKVHKVEEITPHVFRHTWISQMLQYGKVDIKMVSYLAGHRNLTTTQGYAHLLGGAAEQLKAVESLPDYSLGDAENENDDGGG